MSLTEAFSLGGHGDIHMLLGGSWSPEATAYAERADSIVEPFVRKATVSPRCEYAPPRGEREPPSWAWAAGSRRSVCAAGVLMCFVTPFCAEGRRPPPPFRGRDMTSGKSPRAVRSCLSCHQRFVIGQRRARETLSILVLDASPRVDRACEGACRVKRPRQGRRAMIKVHVSSP